MSLDLQALMAHKDKVVKDNTAGIEYLFKKNKIDWIKGKGRIAAVGRVEVDGKTYTTKNILIATGSGKYAFAGHRSG